MLNSLYTYWLFIFLLLEYATSAKSRVSSTECRWASWGAWSECESKCGAKSQIRNRDCLCPDNTRPDCIGHRNSFRYCPSNCVRSFNYWKFHNIYATGKDFKKPWPVREDTKFECEYGHDESKEEITWYSVIISDTQEEIWSNLVIQFITAVLNAFTGADDSLVSSNITAAEDLVKDCDGYDSEQLILIQQIYSVLEKFNSGQLNVPSCVEKPCCLYSGWDDWSECTQTCGGGTRTRYESCSCPGFGGIPDEYWCTGHRNEDTETCNSLPCNITSSPSDSTYAPTPNEQVSETENIPFPSYSPTPTPELFDDPSNSIEFLCHWDWSPWSNCSQQCEGRQWREMLCICPDLTSKSSIEFCSEPPEAKQYMNCNTKPCNTSNQQINGDQNPIDTPTPQAEEKQTTSDCSWREWGDWTSCSSECGGTRWRRKLCYCEKKTSTYDDSFCGKFPPIEDEHCNNTAACITSPLSPDFWRTHNSGGKGRYYKPWPIPESTPLFCPALITPPSYLSLLSLSPPVTEPPIPSSLYPLIKQYIAAVLNIESEIVAPPSITSAVTECSIILHTCTSDASNRSAELTQILSDWNEKVQPAIGAAILNFGDNQVSQEIKSGNSYQEDNEETIMGWLLGGGVVGGIILILVAIIITIAIMRKRYQERVFEIPDPDFELESDEDLMKLEGGETMGVDSSHGDDSRDYVLGEHLYDMTL